MDARSIEDRVALLENEMQSLRGLPDRVTSLETQMVQFRAEVRVEFSATRKELREEFRKELRKELRGEVTGLRKHIDGKIEELGAQMRTLHEEALARIALISRG